ncbi:MAG: flagellar motor protein MotB [Pseudomonadota bacterium]
MADNKEASIIIKKVKKRGHGGHHGGAWKVAYADFVTAMMAFFLLLWLLQATAQSQKEGLAEYFTPTIGVRDAAGIGFKGGKTSYDEGRKVAEKSMPGIVVGRMPQGSVAQKQDKQANLEAQNEESLDNAKKDIKQAIEEDPNFRDFKDNVIVEQTPEGLKIEIIDDDKLPMFEAKGTQLTQSGEKILHKLAAIIKMMPNRVSITGHTESTNYAISDAVYTNWELTADRANAARRFLMSNNLEPGRIAKVVGRADQELLDTKLPTSPRNRRITVILLRASYMKTIEENTPAPQNLLTVPKPTDKIRNDKFYKIEAAPVETKSNSKKDTEDSQSSNSGRERSKNLSSEFKLPENLQKYKDSENVDSNEEIGKANKGLNSLPSGLIKNDDER